MTKVIVVTKKDQILGYRDKERCHQKNGILHRAFSIVVINGQREILLQQRSKYKRLWPFYWSNTCCSHPDAKPACRQAGEAKKELIQQAEKRLKEEMGFTLSLKPIFKFYYQAKYKDIGSENELVTVLLGKYQGEKIKPDKDEVADYRWLSLSKLKREVKEKLESYTPWFKKIIKRLNDSQSLT